MGRRSRAPRPPWPISDCHHKNCGRAHFGRKLTNQTTVAGRPANVELIGPLRMDGALWAPPSPGLRDPPSGTLGQHHYIDHLADAGVNWLVVFWTNAAVFDAAWREVAA